jgi:hypothetical protein
MGIGSYPVGTGTAGFDPASITPATSTVGAAAYLFDPFARDILLDDQGHYIETHPVDSKVMLALGIPIGTVKSATTIGGTLADLPIDDSVVMTAEAGRRVSAALSDLIDAGDVIISFVNAWADPNYRAHVEIGYQNLRLSTAEAQAEVQKLLLLGAGGP